LHRRMFFLAGTASLASFAIATGAAERNLHQDGAEWFTNVEVKTQDGQTLRFYDDVLKGKIVMINFFFTECDAICPLMTENLCNVQALPGPRVGKDIFMTSIRCDLSMTRRRCLPPTRGLMAWAPAGCSSPAERTILNSSGTAWGSSIPIRFRTLTSRSILAPCASPTYRFIGGP
jgi:SCO1/SenC